VTPRRMVRAFFCLVLACMIGIPIGVFFLEPSLLGAPPWIVVKAGLMTAAGMLLVPLVFFVLLHMRASRWIWFTTGLVALFSAQWFLFDGLSVCRKIGMWEAMVDEEMGFDAFPPLLSWYWRNALPVSFRSVRSNRPAGRTGAGSAADAWRVVRSVQHCEVGQPIAAGVVPVLRAGTRRYNVYAFSECLVSYRAVTVRERTEGGHLPFADLTAP